MSREMLINNLPGQECRIAIVEDGHLQELYVERSSSASHVGNIYKGRITNIEPGIQAAFVDFGLGKNGFLHISDIHPQYFSRAEGSAAESVGRKQPRRDRPPIQHFLKRGQEVVVQLTKEGIGTKGPTLTTYLSIPGRMLVMMPGMSKLGVSRKIEDEETRAKARAALAELKLPDDMGFIVRTAGIDRPKRELQRDLNYLLRLWKTVKQRIRSAQAPAEIYQESDLVIRTIRDVYNSDIKRVICDNEADARKVKEFVNVVMPRGGNVIEVYKGDEGLFYEAGLEEEIERIYARHVELPSGGSLVIDQTEALVAIDVNSGRMREHSDSETTALKTNLEAAAEIGRQLRIRDMGGMVVIDFIDMMNEKHRHEVEKAFKDAIKPDRAKTKILRMSQFGLVEMTRQRMRPSLKQSIYRTCEHCNGAGVVKSEQSQVIHAMRVLQTLCANDNVAAIRLSVPLAVADHLNNTHRRQLYELEENTGKGITVGGRADLNAEEMLVEYTDRRGGTAAWAAGEKTTRGKKKALPTVNIEQLKSAPRAPSRPAGPDKGKRTTGSAQAGAPVAEEVERGKTKKSRRRGRRGGRKSPPASSPESNASEAAGATISEQNGAPTKETGSSEPRTTDKVPPAKDSSEEPPPEVKGKATRRKRPSRRRKSAHKAGPSGNAKAEHNDPSPTENAGEAEEPPKPESAGFQNAAAELASGWPLAD